MENEHLSKMETKSLMRGNSRLDSKYTRVLLIVWGFPKEFNVAMGKYFC